MRSKIHFITLFLFFIASLSACPSRSIFLTVLDAETHEPIEGAVALAYWNDTEGVGLTYTRTMAIVEESSDIDGKTRIPSVSASFSTHSPQLKVYKYGYVGWSSKFVYLGSYEDNFLSIRTERRNNFKWTT